jgi:hypothetical protein
MDDDDYDLYNRLIKLTEKNTELQNSLYHYKSKLESKEKLLQIYLEESNSAINTPKSIRKNDKLDYFNTHKNDKDITEHLMAFKEAYPNIPVPRALIKHFTDKKYEVELKSKK